MKKSIILIISVVISHFILIANVKISSFQLSNGIRIILSPVHDTQASCVLLYHLTGARNDPANLKGGSYLYQNLMFQPTKNLDAYDRIMFVRQNGGSGNIRIYQDVSISTQVVPDNYLNNALWLESERISSLQLSDNAISFQKNATFKRYSKLFRSNLKLRAFAWVKSQIFTGTAYQLPVYGSLEKIRLFNNNGIRDLYNNFRNLSNIIIVITGKYNLAELEKNITENFSRLRFKRKPANTNYKNYQPLKKYIYKNWLIENYKSNFIVFGFRAPAKVNPEFLPYTFIKYFLTDSRISNLEKMLNRVNRLNVTISYEFTGNFESNAFMVLIASPKRSTLEKARYILKNELVALRNRLLSASDIKITKSLMEIDFLKSYNNLEQRSIMIAENYHLFGNLDIKESYLKRLRKINSYDIIRISKKYLKKENQVVLNVYSR